MNKTPKKLVENDVEYYFRYVFKDYRKIKSSNDSKGKIEFLVGTKLIRILLFSGRKFYI